MTACQIPCRAIICENVSHPPIGERRQCPLWQENETDPAGKKQEIHGTMLASNIQRICKNQNMNPNIQFFPGRYPLLQAPFYKIHLFPPKAKISARHLPKVLPFRKFPVHLQREAKKEKKKDTESSILSKALKK